MRIGYSLKKAKKMTKMTFDLSDYKQVALLNTGLNYISSEDINREITTFSKDFDLEIVHRDDGNQDLFVSNY